MTVSVCETIVQAKVEVLTRYAQMIIRAEIGGGLETGYQPRLSIGEHDTTKKSDLRLSKMLRNGITGCKRSSRSGIGGYHSNVI